MGPVLLNTTTTTATATNKIITGAPLDGTSLTQYYYYYYYYYNGNSYSWGINWGATRWDQSYSTLTRLLCYYH